ELSGHPQHHSQLLMRGGPLRLRVDGASKEPFGDNRGTKLKRELPERDVVLRWIGSRRLNPLKHCEGAVAIAGRRQRASEVVASEIYRETRIHSLTQVLH